jgi:hypothetical protein
MITSLRENRSLTAIAVVLASLLGLAGALALGVSAPAYAADKGLVALEPVSFDGTTYTGTDPKGPFSIGYPKGLDKNDPDSATAALSDKVKAGTTYPWGSVGAKNGSFIQNNTGKNICKIVVSTTDGSTFDTAPQSGANWTATVSKDKQTITFTAVKDPDNCIKNGGWFWMQVPESPQPGSGTPPTLSGSIAALTPDPNGETAVAELTATSAFVSTLYDVDAWTASATASPTPSGTTVATTGPTGSPTSSPSATATVLPTGVPTSPPTDPATTWSPAPTTPAGTATAGVGQ